MPGNDDERKVECARLDGIRREGMSERKTKVMLTEAWTEKAAIDGGRMLPERDSQTVEE